MPVASEFDAINLKIIARVMRFYEKFFFKLDFSNDLSKCLCTNLYYFARFIRRIKSIHIMSHVRIYSRNWCHSFFFCSSSSSVYLFRVYREIDDGKEV